VKFLVKAQFPGKQLDRVAETSENWSMGETSENWSMGETSENWSIGETSENWSMGKFRRTNFNCRSNTNTYNYPFVIIHSVFL
jgi:hypothetical protein